MKKIFILALALLSVAVTNAKVYTVSNNPNTPAQYTDLQAAIDASSNNDTIYVHGSNTIYGDISITKKITLIGTGYLPNTQSQLQSKITTITLGSAGAKNTADGVAIIGMVVNYIQHNNAATYGPDSVVIKNCSGSGPAIGSLVTYVNMIKSNNCLIQNCIVGISFDSGSNLLVQNNVIPSQFTITNSQNIIANNNLLIFGNIIEAANVSFNNNIFDGSYITTADHCSFNNNLISLSSPSNVLPPSGNNNTGTGNLNDVDPLFVNSPTYNFDPTYDYNLSANSPAKNAGTDGTDIGMTGGVIPMTIKSAGEPNLPQVRFFNLGNFSIPANGSLQINAKGQKHN